MQALLLAVTPLTAAGNLTQTHQTISQDSRINMIPNEHKFWIPWELLMTWIHLTGSLTFNILNAKSTVLITPQHAQPKALSKSTKSMLREYETKFAKGRRYHCLI
jgi:hypothetical protein